MIQKVLRKPHLRLPLRLPLQLPLQLTRQLPLQLLVLLLKGHLHQKRFMNTRQ